MKVAALLADSFFSLDTSEDDPGPIEADTTFIYVNRFGKHLLSIIGLSSQI
jgi:hypothetical protein